MFNVNQAVEHRHNIIDMDQIHKDVAVVSRRPCPLRNPIRRTTAGTINPRESDQRRGIGYHASIHQVAKATLEGK